jgi:meiosis-specific transcription factor NDT80
MSQADASESKGPGFEETLEKVKVFNSNGTSVKLDINAAIQKGFFEVDQKWTCYRRNYFTVTCSFQISPHQAGPFYLTQHGQSKAIEGWAVSISAKTAPFNNDGSQVRHLVQHTPKRDKKDETTPGKHAVSPQTPQQFQHQHHLQHHHLHGNPHHHHHGGHLVHDPFYPTHTNHLGSFGRAWPETSVSGEPTPPSAYTFERIQFQKATANNGKRRAQQQFFHIVVQLSANVHPVKGEKDWVLVAEKVSDPMVVRGRSPGHYKDNHQRHDRSAHMDDRNGGHGSETHRMSYGGYSNSSWGVQDNSRGHHSQYSGGTHRSRLSSSSSPPSGGSSATLHGSSNDADFGMSDSETLKPVDMYVRPCASTLESDTDEPVFSLSRKNGLEDELGEHSSQYQFNSSLCENISSPVADYPAFLQPKVLCT